MACKFAFGSAACVSVVAMVGTVTLVVAVLDTSLLVVTLPMGVVVVDVVGSKVSARASTTLSNESLG